jgi:hypothetical protein
MKSVRDVNRLSAENAESEIRCNDLTINESRPKVAGPMSLITLVLL